MTSRSAIDFIRMKQNGEKITMVTCYDFWSAKVLNDSKVDCLLVGDSAAMVMHGHDSTIPASTAMMTTHVSAVAEGASNKFIIGDLPFLSFRKGLGEAMNCVENLMQAGAHAVKLEGVDGHDEIISHIIESGVPVIGHLGLTPQSIHKFGGFHVQARGESAEEHLLSQAKKLEDYGCFSLVLECIPAKLSSLVTQNLTIPTIGIGAGPDCDGQVLVLQDLLGVNPEFNPKFLKKYLDGYTLIRNAVDEYTAEVKNSKFPTARESYK